MRIVRRLPVIQVSRSQSVVYWKYFKNLCNLGLVCSQSLQGILSFSCRMTCCQIAFFRFHFYQFLIPRFVLGFLIADSVQEVLRFDFL